MVTKPRIQEKTFRASHVGKVLKIVVINAFSSHDLGENFILNMWKKYSKNKGNIRPAEMRKGHLISICSSPTKKATVYNLRFSVMG